MPRMYHPSLGREVDLPDDPDCVAVNVEAGWELAPEPEATSPAHAAEPVTYAPVAPTPADEPKPKARRA